MLVKAYKVWISIFPVQIHVLLQIAVSLMWHMCHFSEIILTCPYHPALMDYTRQLFKICSQIWILLKILIYLIYNMFHLSDFKISLFRCLESILHFMTQLGNVHIWGVQIWNLLNEGHLVIPHITITKKR